MAVVNNNDYLKIFKAEINARIRAELNPERCAVLEELRDWLRTLKTDVLWEQLQYDGGLKTPEHIQIHTQDSNPGDAFKDA